MDGNRNKQIQVINPFQNFLELSKIPAVVAAFAAQPALFKKINSLEAESKPEASIRKEQEDYFGLFLSRPLSDLPADQRILSLQKLKKAAALYHHLVKEVSAGLKYSLFHHSATGNRLRQTLARVVSPAVASLPQPRVTYRSVTGHFHPQGIRLQPSNQNLTGHCLHRFFHDQTDDPVTLVCFVSTIGDRFEYLLRNDISASEDPLEQYLLHAFLAGLADTIVEDFQQWLTTQYKPSPNNPPLRRISPGYKDWPLRDQELLFSLLHPEETIGVRLNATQLMIPLKSVSGISGPFLTINSS